MKQKSLEILESYEKIHISAQVINEFVSATAKKSILSFDDASKLAQKFMNTFEFLAIDKNLITKALEISKTTNYSYYDTLIISAALISKCTILFSEDLQNGQTIEKLKIINPYK